MKIGEAFPSRYLSKEDMKDGPRLGVIETVDLADIEGEDGKESKPILYFQNDLKPMVLNRVNWMTVQDLYGEDSVSWKGQRIELYHDPSIMFGAKRVGGIRVRKPTNGNSQPGPLETLKTIRAQIKAAGGTVQPLVATDIDTPEKIQALIDQHKDILAVALAAAL